MTANSTKRDRRDWTLIIFLLPIGILLMVLAGQFAIRLVPSWSVNAGMGSNLDPETASGQQSGFIPPISFDILTPMAWLDTFLTPGPDSANQDLSFAPFVVFEPSATPTASATASVSSTPATPSGTPTGTTTPGVTATWTRPPRDDDPTSTATATATTPAPVCTDPAANNTGGPLPCTYDPVCTDPAANNTGGPLPCTYDPVCTDPAANNTGGPLPCTYDPITSTPEGSPTAVPGNTTIGTPDGFVGNIPDGYYITLNLGGNPIVVNGSAETGYYDFVYYELPSGSGIQMDRVILSISTDDVDYYVVFNWGDGTPDNNSNVGDVAGGETDNQPIDSSELYGTAPQDTGILVDVDNAPSNPPTGSYQYLAIQAPEPPSVDGADVDSVEVIEVPIPTP